MPRDGTATYPAVVQRSAVVASLRDLLAVVRHAHPEGVNVTLRADDGRLHGVNVYYAGEARDAGDAA